VFCVGFQLEVQAGSSASAGELSSVGHACRTVRTRRLEGARRPELRVIRRLSGPPLSLCTMLGSLACVDAYQVRVTSNHLSPNEHRARKT
jgi:hypothetical protein